jgi:flotillin
MDPAQLIGVSIGLGALGLLLLIVFIKANIVICQPNEIVILSGRQRKLADGTLVGYRTLRGGRGFKWPLVESVARLPLTTMPVEIRLTRALTKGIIPINVEGRANVKVAGRTEEGLENAIERFLGKNPDAISRVAQQTVEGALRGVIASVSPEEANAQRLELGRQVAETARAELSSLGIVLDFFQVQNIDDDDGYLEAIGRKKNAEVRRDAQIAEATAEAEAIRVSAEQRRLGRMAEVSADTEITTVENELAVHRATLGSERHQAEQRASVAGQIARVESENELEAKRIELNEKKHQAQTIIPAEAECRAMELRARGESARILENGKATADAIRKLQEEWKDGSTRELFLIQMLPDLLDKVTSVIADNLHVEKLTVLDSGDGQGGLPNYVKNITNSAVVLIEQLKNATGLDVTDILKKGNGSPKRPGEIPRDLS